MKSLLLILLVSGLTFTQAQHKHKECTASSNKENTTQKDVQEQKYTCPMLCTEMW